MPLDSAAPLAAAGPLAGVICVLGLVAVAGWVAWRFGPTLARVTGWCSWWVAWACGSQGGYGYCIAFLVLGAVGVGRRHALVRQAPWPLAFGALGAAVHPSARRPQPAHAARDPRRRDLPTPPPLTRAAPERSTRALRHTTLAHQLSQCSAVASLGSRPHLPPRTHQRRYITLQPRSQHHRKATPPLGSAALRLTAHSCT